MNAKKSDLQKTNVGDLQRVFMVNLIIYGVPFEEKLAKLRIVLRIPFKRRNSDFWKQICEYFYILQSLSAESVYLSKKKSTLRYQLDQKKIVTDRKK